MLSNRLTLPLLTLLVCSLQVGEVNAALKAQSLAADAPTAASAPYFALDKYKELLPKITAELAKNNAAGLATAKKHLGTLQEKAPVFDEIIKKFTEGRLDGFMNLSKNDKLPDFKKGLTAAQAEIDGLENRLLQQLKLEYEQLELDCDLKNKHFQTELDSLSSRCLDLEDHFLQLPGETTNKYLKKLNALKSALIERGKDLKRELAVDEEAKKNATSKQPVIQPAPAPAKTTWQTLTQKKYMVPLLIALFVATGLTYAEKKHLLLSRFLGLQRAKAPVQLSWWARNWSWFKRLLRLHA